MPQNDPGEVIRLYYALQAKMGGNVPWTSLHPVHQNEFTEACNVILQICSSVYQQETNN